MEKTEARRLRPSALGDRAAPVQKPFPEQPEVQSPLDIAGSATPALIAQQVQFRRQPPEMVLTWAQPDPVGTAAGASPDVALVSALPTPEFAFRLAELAARLEPLVQKSGSPEARRGLGALLLQARMYEHLHLLQTTPGDAA